MPPDNIKDIQQRLHELSAEEARLLADIQVSLAGIERIHAQRRMEELTLAELHKKAEDDRHEREDRKSRTKQGNHGQAGNRKRDAGDQHRRSEPAKRQRNHRGPNNAYGWQGEQGMPVSIPGSSNHGNRNQRHNQPSGGLCKCSRVDVHCGGNGSACAVCKALGCAGVAQSRHRNRKRGGERHNNAPPVASSAASTWPHNAVGIINIDADVMDSQG